MTNIVFVNFKESEVHVILQWLKINKFYNKHDCNIW